MQKVPQVLAKRLRIEVVFFMKKPIKNLKVGTMIVTLFMVGTTL